MVTYKMPIGLQHENALWRGGFCLSSANFNELNAKAEIFLHPKEKKHLEGLRHTRRQESYLLGRYCAKQAIAASLNSDRSCTILIEGGVFHQPVVYHNACDNIQVSISHTEHLGGAFAFPEAHPMAIDVETVSEANWTAIREDTTDDELKFASLFFACEMKSLTQLWTAKEALSKALKCGLTIPLNLLEVAAVIPRETFMFVHFKNFSQYQAISFEVGNAVCSIVYPKNSKLDIDIPQIQEKFGF